MTEKLEPPPEVSPRLRRAVEKISLDADLRLLFAGMLESFGVGRTPLGDTPEGTFLAIGRQAAGFEIIQVLDSVDPKLYPALLMIGREKETET